MKAEKTYIPKKRDLKKLLDLISSLRSNREFKTELAVQSTLQQKLINNLKKPVLLHHILRVIMPVIFTRKIINRKLDYSKSKQDLAVKQKTEKIYEKNVLIIEDDLSDLFEISEDNFDQMVELIEKLVESNPECLDGIRLLEEYEKNKNPIQVDKLSLFLTMEETWLRFRK